MSFYLSQLVRSGFFHCDPHPGNVAVDAGYPGGRLVYYDFGMMSELPLPLKKGLCNLIFANYANDPIDACNALEQMEVL